MLALLAALLVQLVVVLARVQVQVLVLALVLALALALALVVLVLVLARVLVASVPCQSLLQTSRLLGASQVCQSPHRHAWMQRSHHCPLALQRLPRLPLQLPWSGLQAHRRFPRFEAPLLMCLCACTLVVWISVRRQLVL